METISRRISSGDAGAPLNPPLTAEEVALGGRLDEFLMITADGDDGHRYQWSFVLGTSQADAQGMIRAWFQSGKPAAQAPMLSAVDVAPPASWVM